MISMRDHPIVLIDKPIVVALHPTGHEFYHLLLTTHSVPPQLQTSLFTTQRAIAEAGTVGLVAYLCGSRASGQKPSSHRPVSVVRRQHQISLVEREHWGLLVQSWHWFSLLEHPSGSPQWKVLWTSEVPLDKSTRLCWGWGRMLVVCIFDPVRWPSMVTRPRCFGIGVSLSVYLNMLSPHQGTLVVFLRTAGGWYKCDCYPVPAYHSDL
jgi:hypothetical protein